MEADTGSARARRVLAGVWAFRARAELEAIERFRRLSRELADVGAERVVVDMASAAVDDESRHAELCNELAQHYGARPQFTTPSAPSIGPRDVSASDRVLYEVVAFCCVTETLNTALMKVAYDRARVAYARKAVHDILRDEVRHSRLGWAHLAAARAAGRGDFIGRMLPRMLAGAVRVELFTANEDDATPEEVERLGDHAELPQSTRVQVFEATARDVLFPGFEGFGIDTSAARSWVAAALARCG